MKILPVAEVRSHFSSLLKEVESGEEIGISFGKRKETIAVIVPIQEYKKAVESDPTLLKGDTLRNRVRITRDGEYTLRDPMLDLAQAGDVIVEDARIDRVTRSNWLGESETLRVTGYVVNNGVRDVGNVQIEVTIKDIWDAIQGTRVLHIGELHAGSKKPFMIRMDEFTGASQDIKNIYTVVYYDK